MGLSIRKVLVLFSFIGFRLRLLEFECVMIECIFGIFLSSVCCMCWFMLSDVVSEMDGVFCNCMIRLFLFIVGMNVLLIDMYNIMVSVNVVFVRLNIVW